MARKKTSASTETETTGNGHRRGPKGVPEEFDNPRGYFEYRASQRTEKAVTAIEAIGKLGTSRLPDGSLRCEYDDEQVDVIENMLTEAIQTCLSNLRERPTPAVARAQGFRSIFDFS